MKKILVLEDEASIRSFIVINLRRAGYDVIEAETGEEALERLRANPDTKVALLDIMLPGIDGFEVCRRIRATNSRIGIIMILYAERKIRTFNVLGKCIDLAGQHRVQCTTHIQIHSTGTAGICQENSRNHHGDCLLASLIRSHCQQLVLHGSIIGGINFKSQGEIIKPILHYDGNIEIHHTRRTVLLCHRSPHTFSSLEVQQRIHHITCPFDITAIHYLKLFQWYHR